MIKDVDAARKRLEKARSDYRVEVCKAFPTGDVVAVKHYHGRYHAEIVGHCYEEGYVMVRNLRSMKTTKRHYSELESLG